MDSLPTEVLVLIFSYLPVGDILSCIKVCRSWNEILGGHESLLSNKACVLKCTSKICRARQLWNMIAKRQPAAVVLLNADPVTLQLLLKYHPSLVNLSVTIQLKDLKKVLRTVCLFKGLQELGLHVKGGSQLNGFSLDWINSLPLLRKLSLTEVGCVTLERVPYHPFASNTPPSRLSELTHFTLNYPSSLPDSDTLKRIIPCLTCLEIKSVSDDKFSILQQNFHNLRTVVLTACNCSDLVFPVSLIKELRIQGTVRGKLELDKILDLQKIHVSLQQPLPECMLPGTVTELSLRGTVSNDPHWLLGLSINCGSISKLDLNGFSLKCTIAASLGMRFPKVTHLNIKGCLGRNVDHMYLIALIQDAQYLTSLSCDTPYSCRLHHIREIFPHCWLSSVDYKYVTVTSHLPPLQSRDVVIDMGENEDNPTV